MLQTHKQTTTKLRCYIFKNARGDRASRREKKSDLRSAQLGWVIPPRGSRLGPPEQPGGGGGKQPS